MPDTNQTPKETPVTTPKPTPEPTPEELAGLCREKVCPGCTQLAEQKQELLRVLADSENFKKRLNREKEEVCKFATERVMEDLVPVLDNLDLALEHGRRMENCKELLAGVEMTMSILLDTLKRHGLEQVGMAGEDFDPAIHEAVGREDRADMQEGKVCTLYQKGYTLKGRLLRPAKVLVSRSCPT